LQQGNKLIHKDETYSVVDINRRANDRLFGLRVESFIGNKNGKGFPVARSQPGGKRMYRSY